MTEQPKESPDFQPSLTEQERRYLQRYAASLEDCQARFAEQDRSDRRWARAVTVMSIIAGVVVVTAMASCAVVVRAPTESVGEALLKFACVLVGCPVMATLVIASLLLRLRMLSGLAGLFGRLFG